MACVLGSSPARAMQRRQPLSLHPPLPFSPTTLLQPAGLLSSGLACAMQHVHSERGCRTCLGEHPGGQATKRFASPTQRSFLQESCFIGIPITVRAVSVWPHTHTHTYFSANQPPAPSSQFQHRRTPTGRQVGGECCMPPGPCCPCPNAAHYHHFQRSNRTHQVAIHTAPPQPSPRPVLAGIHCPSVPSKHKHV